jgi:hypothetical protein
MLGNEVWRKGPSDDSVRLAKRLSIFGVVLALWTVFKPWPYPVVIVLNALAPWLAVLAVWRWDLSLADANEWDARPETAALWLTPSLVLGLRGQDHHFVDSGMFWATLGLAAPLWIAMLLVDARARRWWVVLLLTLPCLAWAWGGLSYLDVGPDRSQSTLVAARVLESWDPSRGSPTMTVMPLSPIKPGRFDNIRISDEVFALYPPGSTVCLEIHEGYLGWRYLYVVDCL